MPQYHITLLQHELHCARRRHAALNLACVCVYTYSSISIVHHPFTLRSLRPLTGRLPVRPHLRDEPHDLQALVRREILRLRHSRSEARVHRRRLVREAL
eukprot:scaffold19757_cov113-Isochrysis_galbana.AAC.5